MNFSIFFSPSDLDRLSTLTPSEPSLSLLARGIASSPLWATMPKAELFFRLSPPEIRISGQFDTADIARLKALAWQTKHALRTFRYIRFADAEEDCRLLLSKLNERFGPEYLKSCCFTCIPRGGLIVLGILSYLADLKRWQLEPPTKEDTPLIVVDDCSLRGTMFSYFLQRSQRKNIIFAPLYSRPELRSAITEKEDSVKAVIGARDLETCEFASPEDENAFMEIFESDTERPIYWTGLLEYLCFAWNEPHYVFWNPVTKTMEAQWTIFPHDLCLKNGPVRIPVQIVQDVHREFRVGEEMITIQENDCVTIEHLSKRDRYQLKGIASEMWNAFIEEGSQEALLSRFEEEYEIDEATLKSDITTFFGDLQSQGILKS